jgi:hypothetical protein
MSHDAKCRECGEFFVRTPSGCACPNMCGRIFPKVLADELAKSQLVTAVRMSKGRRARFTINGRNGVFKKTRKSYGCIRAMLEGKRLWLCEEVQR